MPPAMELPEGTDSFPLIPIGNSIPRGVGVLRRRGLDDANASENEIRVLFNERLTVLDRNLDVLFQPL